MSIVNEYASRLASTLDKSILLQANLKDYTVWEDIAKPTDAVTRSYIQAYPNLRGLASLRALRSHSDACLERGPLHPFVVGDSKSNGLLTAVCWINNLQSARMISEGHFSVDEALPFAVQGSQCWHLLRARSKLSAFVASGCQEFSEAADCAASCLLSKSSAVQALASELAHRAFIFECPRLPARPSMRMEDEVWKALHEGQSTDADVSSLFPAVVDKLVKRRENVLPSSAEMNSEKIWQQLYALCQLLGVSEGLSFDVG